MTVATRFDDEEVRITRYRELTREVSDPFALCLLRLVAEDLEADLRGAFMQRAVRSHVLSLANLA
jgi:hypothetical protein